MSTFSYCVILFDRYGGDTSPALIQDVQCGNPNFQVLSQCDYSSADSSCTDHNDVYVSCCKYT